ncbi:MAG: T9SS type A sorting domain-containing protein [Flavobacteriales bacterium]|nr:T9SS type A sorting domain-containing protein [Flavobacteriales bacterium]
MKKHILSLPFFSLLFLLLGHSLVAQNPYKIPVVVHVIHADGSENISDEQIKNGIQILTRNWRKQNPDTAEIVPVFKPIAADMEVEFELAKFDPDGNCTNGINRIRSELTTTGGHNVKSLIHWPRNKYLNVYVVRNAAGLAGHALMPFQADSLPGWDGIVIQGSYFGNIGTSNDLRSVVLSHEVGHYLNLFHIWGGNNVPEFYYLPVGQSINCTVGDSVADTPQTIGWSSCNLNSESCDGQLDNVQNFMDYAYCARMFTQGQKQRVHDALNSATAERNNLWTPANLAATGLSVDAPLCAADFYTNKKIACINQPIQFFDASYHDPVSWNWNVGSGNPPSAASFTYSYPASGKYDVSLNVSDGTEQLSILREGYIKIVENTPITLPYIEGFESWTSMNAGNMHSDCPDFNCFEWQNVAATGMHAIKLEGNGNTPDHAYRLTTPRLDLSQTPDPVIYFKYAFAQRDTANTDRLLIKLSKDCGQTWITRRTISAADLPTVDNTVSGDFVPGNGDWDEVLITGIPSLYRTDNILVRFELISGGGNHFYLDDIYVYDISTVTVKEPGESEWFISPNPTESAFVLYGPFPSQQVEIFDMNGKSVFSSEQVPTGAEVSVSSFPAGLYYVRLSYQGVTAYRKLMVSR